MDQEQVSKGFEDLGFAKVDHDRGRRQGAGEVIYGAGKTADQIAAICRSLHDAGQPAVLTTRIAADVAHAVGAMLEQTHPDVSFVYHEAPRLAVFGQTPDPDGNGMVVVAAAGTSDLPVAEEAAITAECLGSKVVRLYDVGVAGVHRLLSYEDVLQQAQAVVAVAGMEGALASVVGGLSHCPVIAVPTSVGYGASFNGLSALLSMLNSCASNVSVVNIDNGFGAGFQANLINHARIK